MSVQEKERALFAVWDQICARQSGASLDGLDHRDRVFAAIWMLEAEVNNGGFSQWMFNSTGDAGEFVVTALREVGAEKLAGVCERFFALLPGGVPLPDQDSRQAQLDTASATLGDGAFESACALLEQEFYRLEDELRDQLWAFVQAHAVGA